MAVAALSSILKNALREPTMLDGKRNSARILAHLCTPSHWNRRRSFIVVVFALFCTLLLTSYWSLPKRFQPEEEHVVFVFSHIPKTGGSSVGEALVSVLGRNSTCHTMQLLAWIKLRHNAFVDSDANVMLAQWISGKFDNQLNKEPLADRSPLSHLPPVPPFKDTIFIWAQHQDAGIVDLISCIRKETVVKGITWLRDPVNRFYSSFYYAKYKYPPKMKQMQNVSLVQYIAEKFHTSGITHIRRTNIYINWFAGVSSLFQVMSFDDHGTAAANLPDRCRSVLAEYEELLPQNDLPRSRYDRIQRRALLRQHDFFVGILECAQMSWLKMLERIQAYHPIAGGTHSVLLTSVLNRNDKLDTLQLPADDQKQDDIGALVCLPLATGILTTEMVEM